MVYSNEPIRYYKNRKGKPDPVIRWLELSSILVWIIYMFNIVAILAAKPVEEGLFDRFFNVPVERLVGLAAPEPVPDHFNYPVRHQRRFHFPEHKAHKAKI